MSHNEMSNAVCFNDQDIVSTARLELSQPESLPVIKIERSESISMARYYSAPPTVFYRIDLYSWAISF